MTPTTRSNPDARNLVNFTYLIVFRHNYILVRWYICAFYVTKKILHYSENRDYEKKRIATAVRESFRCLEIASRDLADDNPKLGKPTHDF